MDKKTGKAIAGGASALAALLVGGGLRMIESPTLGYLLIGAGVALALFAVIQFGWFPFLARTYIQYSVYAIVGVVFLPLALFAPHKEPGVPKDIGHATTTPPITATVQGSPGSTALAIGKANDVTINQIDSQKLDAIDKKLDAMISGLSGNVTRRLEQEYPLGFVLIAFSGEVKKVLPRSDVVEGDWNGLTVNKDNQNMINVEIPYLLDKRGGSSFVDCSLGTLAVPGSVGGLTLGKLSVQIACLAADPVGICAVLGFKDSVDKAHKKGN